MKVPNLKAALQYMNSLSDVAKDVAPALTRDEQKMLRAAMADVKPIDRRRVSTAQDDELSYFTRNDPGATLQAPLKHTKYVHKYGE